MGAFPLGDAVAGQGHRGRKDTAPILTPKWPYDAVRKRVNGPRREGSDRRALAFTRTRVFRLRAWSPPCPPPRLPSSRAIFCLLVFRHLVSQRPVSWPTVSSRGADSAAVSAPASAFPAAVCSFSSLALVHMLARRSTNRGMILALFYALLVFALMMMGWRAIVPVAALGLISHLANLRRRFGGPGQA